MIEALSMLLSVALNQTRFTAPGLAPDSRGVVMGKQGVLLFSSFDQLVSFFRVFCDEAPLDDLGPQLKIHQVRSPVDSRELLVLFHATSSHLLDRAARIARGAGGRCFTGSGKHYVKYRDSSSPLGYDAAKLHGEPAELVMYDQAFTQGYARVKELAFQQLLFGLAPRALPGADEDDRELLWLTARRGLRASLLTYLWRNQVRAEAAEVSEAAPAGLFEEAPAFLLARVHALPLRMLRLFRAVPGIRVFRPVLEQCLVELGFRHPLRLEACAVAIDPERFYLLGGSEPAVEVLGSRPSLVPAQSLLGGSFDPAGTGAVRERVPVQAERIAIQLRVVASSSATARGRITGVLVPWAQAPLLKRIVYALPETLLGAHRVAAIAEGLLVLGDLGIDRLPIGQLLQEPAPGVLVPLGCELMPRVAPAVLVEHLGGVAGRVVVFLRESGPLSVEHAAFAPLERRVLAPLRVTPSERDSRLPPGPVDRPATVVNEPVGALPLWGFREEP